MSESLSIKYRPQTFEEVCSQDSIVKILNQQISTSKFKNCYLFSGPSGTGKTTIARIMAMKINEYRDNAGNICSAEPIEIDAASNNGVDNIRVITEGATRRSLDGKYKVFIIDECHMLTAQSWNALLKTIEETPKYTIFMFCTTEYHKVPTTIQNRCQQYFLTRVPLEVIIKRLQFICQAEGITATTEGLSHIAKLSQGSVRLAISYLEKCIDYNPAINIENVLKVLGDFSYDTYFNLTNAVIDKNTSEVINVIEKLYSDGSDLKLFTDMYINFVLDLAKYNIFKTFDVIEIPASYKEQVEYTINVEDAGKYYMHLVDNLLKIKQLIKGDSNIKTTLEISLMKL